MLFDDDEADDDNDETVAAGGIMNVSYLNMCKTSSYFIQSQKAPVHISNILKATMKNVSNIRLACCIVALHKHVFL